MRPYLHARVLRGRRRAGRRERAEGGDRLEGAPQHAEGCAEGAGAPGPPLPRGVPRPLRLHAVADQHRRPAQVPVLPEVRLAADRQPGAALPGRRRGTRARRARWSGRRSPRSSARSRSGRTTSPRSSSSRSRPRAATTTSAPSSCAELRRLADEHEALLIFDEVQTRRRPDRAVLGARALRRAARPARVRQEDAGLRHDGRAAARRGARERLQGVEPHQLHLGRQPRGHGPLAALPRDHRGGAAGGARRRGRRSTCWPACRGWRPTTRASSRTRAAWA